MSKVQKKCHLSPTYPLNKQYRSCELEEKCVEYVYHYLIYKYTSPHSFSYNLKLLLLFHILTSPIVFENDMKWINAKHPLTTSHDVIWSKTIKKIKNKKPVCHWLTDWLTDWLSVMVNWIMIKFFSIDFYVIWNMP